MDKCADDDDVDSPSVLSFFVDSIGVNVVPVFDELDVPKSKSKNCVFVNMSRSLAKSSADRESVKLSGEVEFKFAIGS